MVDLNTSPHSEHERKVQRLYEEGQYVLALWNDGDIDVSADSLNGAKVWTAFNALATALSAFDGKAFNEVKS